MKDFNFLVLFGLKKLEIKKNDIKVMSDSDLMSLYRLAQEMQCGKYITACKKEMSRRNAEV